MARHTQCESFVHQSSTQHNVVLVVVMSRMNLIGTLARRNIKTTIRHTSL